ncbi:hypothetical protein ACLOJK_002031, partial [Asimina triloba]
MVFHLLHHAAANPTTSERSDRHGDVKLISSPSLMVDSGHIYTVRSVAPIWHLFFFNGADKLKSEPAMATHQMSSIDSRPAWSI